VKAVVLAAVAMLAVNSSTLCRGWAQSVSTTATDQLAYKGFTADISAISGRPDRQALLDALKRQIDICERSGVSAQTMAFFRSVPLVMETKGGPHASGRKVVMTAEIFPPDNPVLLHEYLHAYHARRLPNGANNPDILKYYRRARDTPGLWPVKSYMLTNAGEYFAMTASVFLHGRAAREPFDRNTLKAKQPAYYSWLEKEFGKQPGVPDAMPRPCNVARKNG
jgi:hypothetical protein